MSAELPEARQRRRKEERPDEILAAALTVFTRDGFAGARLDEIARLAGCTKGTIYVYFESKEDLFKAVVRNLVAPTFRTVETILVDDALDTVTKIKRFITGAYRNIVENPTAAAMIRLLLTDGPRFPELVDIFHSEIGRQGQANMAATLRRGVETGELRPIDPEIAVHVIFGPIVATNMRMLMDGGRNVPVDLDKMLQAHLDIVLNGLVATR